MIWREQAISETARHPARLLACVDSARHAIFTTAAELRENRLDFPVWQRRKGMQLKIYPGSSHFFLSEHFEEAMADILGFLNKVR